MIKNLLKAYLILLAISTIQISCNGGSENKIDSNKTADTANNATISKDTIVSDNSTPVKDPIVKLLEELKKTPTGEKYKVKGELKTGILKYESMAFGDMLHLTFVDKANKEYEFNGNTTEIELFKDAINPSEDNGGYEANKKYLNKTFRVVWRTIQLKHKPKDEIEMYYEEYDEIIYLKQLD
jgi:hypothetical protein